MENRLKDRSIKACKNHLKNIDNLSKGKYVSYDYLNKCWICEKPFTFFDKITFNIKHSFEGNSHRGNCLK